MRDGMKWAAYVATAFIVVISLVPIDFRPHILASSQLEHFLVYLATGAVFALAFRKPAKVLGFVLFLSVLAGILEIGQIWVPGRTPRIIDWMAGSLGGAAGVFLTLCFFYALNARSPRLQD